jgi:hypothetical protein
MMGGTYLPWDTSYKVPINPEEMIEKHYQTTRTQLVEKVTKYSKKVAIYMHNNMTNSWYQGKGISGVCTSVCIDCR